MSAPRARLLLGVALVAAALGFAITAVEDTDAWTHLALGRDLVELRHFPPTERFVLSGEGLPYVNPEWLFGVVLYLAYLAGGYAGVVGLKAVIVAAAIAILFRDALVRDEGHDDGIAGAAVAALAIAGTLAMARHRFVERPDIVLMLCLALTIHALNRYLAEGRTRLLALLPLVQLVWVNVHPSVIVGFVPFVAVLAGGATQRWLERRLGTTIAGTPSRAQLRTIGLAFGGVALASFVNPYGVEPFVTPFRLVSATWLRHEVIELQPPDLRAYPGVAIATALVALAVLARWRRPAVTTVLLVAPFVYLAFSARRFVFLLAVVAGPIVAREARAALGALPGAWRGRLPVPLCAAALIVTLAPPALAVARVGPFDDPFRVPGFGTNVIGVPEGALAYLDGQALTGPVFNIFHWGGYIAWRDYPRRRPFVDGRGGAAAVLDDMMAVRRDAVRLRQLSARYGFDAAIVDYPRNVMVDETPDADLALVAPDWALVYWDDLALVYLRRTPAHEPIIARDEYRHVKPAMGAGYLRRRLADPARAEAVIAELRRNVALTQSSTAYALLGFAENELGRHERAIAALERVRDFPLGSNVLNAELSLAFAYTRLGDLRRAVEHYDRALARDEDPLTLHNAALLLERLGDDAGAARRLERALVRDPMLVPAYPTLMRVARRQGREQRAAELERGYATALTASQAEGHFKRGVKLYFDGHLERAAAEFRLSVRAQPRNAAARSNLGFVYYDLGRLDDAFAEQTRALEIDPGFANAHYGLALIGRTRGDRAVARAHFESYLRVEPKGYWSRRAAAALGDLSR